MGTAPNVCGCLKLVFTTHGARRNPNGYAQRLLNVDKARWASSVAETIRNAQVMATQRSENLYLRRYATGQLHMVITDQNGGVLDQGTEFDAALITQFAPKPNQQFEGAVVSQVRDGLPAASIAGAGQTLAPQAGQMDETVAIPAQSGQPNDNQRGLAGQSLVSAPDTAKAKAIKQAIATMPPMWQEALEYQLAAKSCQTSLDRIPRDRIMSLSWTHRHTIPLHHRPIPRKKWSTR